MGIEGGMIVSYEDLMKWKAENPEEYAEYEEFISQDENGNWVMTDWPDWANNGDPTDGPFDFALNPSHGTIGW